MDIPITLQIMTGGYNTESVTFDEIRSKLESVLPIIPTSRVIMGWALNKSVYEQTVEFLFARDIECFLWLPVFSEMRSLRPSSPIVGYRGQPARPYYFADGETFDFNCPVDPVNTAAVFSIFKEHFAQVGFNGVFLDKIRYPSFVNGLDGGLSCFCPHCQDAYQEAGLDVEALQAAIKRLPGSSTPFGITEYRGGAYRFADDIWQQFYRLRARLVYDSLSHLTEQLRQEGYLIGMDVFAPFMSQFVGQDVPKLSALCDFVKPMMYRATIEPAGLSFELDAMLKETGCSSAARANFADLMGLDVDQKPFDLDFARRDLAWLSTACHCPVQAGLEFNYEPGVADVDPAYIRETMAAYADASDGGFVLSWNLLEAPEPNIRAVRDWLVASG